MPIKTTKGDEDETSTKWLTFYKLPFDYKVSQSDTDFIVRIPTISCVAYLQSPSKSHFQLVVHKGNA